MPDLPPAPAPGSPGRRFDARSIGIITCVALLAAIGAGLLASFVLAGSDDPPGAATETDRPEPAAAATTPSAPVELLFGEGAFRFADFAGQPTVVNFFSSTCAPCVREMPLLESIHQRLGDQVNFVGIDVTDTKEDGQALVDQTGVTYLTGYDPSAGLVRDFRGVGLPTTVLLDPAGTPVKVLTGELDEGQLEGFLADEGLLPA